MKTSAGPHLMAIVGVWLALVVCSVAVRQPAPADETRYLAVAWEMWSQGELLVPHLNGVPYSHKPPLLFWLIHAGWAVLGVGSLWPRLVPALFALATIGLTFRLASRLWPDRPRVAIIAAWILTGSLGWAVLTTVLLFDMLVAFTTCWGVLSLLSVDRSGRQLGWIAVALALASGVLAKGPVALLHLLPVALLGAVWRDAEGQSTRTWFVGLVAAITGALAMVALWALPAAARGGAVYADAILWGQTTSRLTGAVAHPRAWYWYLAALTLVLFPWLLWPPLWRALGGVRRGCRDPGVRLCLAWLLPVLAALSMIGDKQPHYLLPVLPAFALVAAVLLDSREQAPAATAQLVPAVGFLAVGATLATARWWPSLERWPEWALEVAPGWGVVLVMIGLLPALPGRLSSGARTVLLASSTAAAVIVLHLSVVRAGADAFDMRPVARVLAEGGPVAHVGPYHGQYHFFARLRRPVTVIEPAEIEQWSARNPAGKVVIYLAHWGLQGSGRPDLQRPFRGRTGVSVWGREAIVAEIESSQPRWQR
jgi:4-amino-4-deoxy-L-arabinose transferase-like glycosyltransferase